MEGQVKTKEQLEIEELRARLNEAEQTLSAIRNGEVDALVVHGPAGEQVYTLQGADYAYRVMVESIQEGVGTLQPDGMLLYCNQRLAEMLCIPPQTLVGSNFCDYVSPPDQEIFKALLQAGLSRYGRAELALRCGSGILIPALVSLSSVDLGSTRRLCLVATDLTEQKRNEETVLAERMARSILEQVAEVLVVCDSAGKIIRASRAAFQILNQSLLFRHFGEMFPIELTGPGAGQAQFSIDEVLQGKTVQGLEARLSLAGGTEPGRAIFILLSAAPLRNDRGEIFGCIVSLTDITERRRSEAVRRETELQRLLLEQREQERVRIAQNLHDGPLQDLIGLSFTFQAMVSGPEDNQDRVDSRGGSLDSALREARENILQLVGELREVCNELRPSTLVRFGLARAIHYHAGDFEARNRSLAVHLDLLDDGDALSPGRRTALFHIYKECLNNILRHARAENVDIRLTMDTEYALLEIQDDGQGFTLPENWVDLARANHFGLVGMKERAEAEGGRFDVLTAPGQGTKVSISVPLND